MKKTEATPKEQFVKMPRGLMASDAWLSMRSGHLKIVSALCEEHLSHAGKDNGRLKLPHRQIVEMGVSPHSVAGLIQDLEAFGLIECTRPGLRASNLYTLTWLPRADGKPPSNAWASYSRPETKKSASERAGRAARERAGRSANLHANQQADCPENLHAKEQALSRRSLPERGDTYSVLEGRGAA